MSTETPAWQILIDQARQALITIQEQARAKDYGAAKRGAEAVAADLMRAARILGATDKSV